MKPKPMMFKTCLSMATRATLTRVLVDHMTANYANGIDWMQDLSFHGAALLSSDLVDDDSMLTLQDLLQELHARKSE